jgi:hypothetical protein
MSNNNQDDSIIQDDALTTAEDEQAIIPDVTSKLSDDDKEGEQLESGEAGSVDESKGESTDDNMEEANNEGEPPVANDGVDEEARLQEEKERKERWKDYPLKDVDEVHDHDVLFGRGGQYFFVWMLSFWVGLMNAHVILHSYFRRHKSSSW